jgi:hypothetical protein
MMFNPVCELQVEFNLIGDAPQALQQTHSLSSGLSVLSISNSRLRQFGQPQSPRRMRESRFREFRSSSGTRRQRRASSGSRSSGYPGIPHRTTRGVPS